MMKKFYFLFAMVFCSVGLFSQTPNGFLDFGTALSGTTATTVNTGFGGVRVGTGGGSLTLQNPGQSIGTDAELRGIAPTTGSVNSVGITSTEYGTAARVFTVSFELHLTGGASGTWSFFAGNGASYGTAQSATFTGNQTFTGIRWVFGAAGAITTDNRAAAVWVNIPGTPFSQNTAYYVTIIGNNSTAPVNYGVAQSLAVNTYDLWVNGVLVGDDLAKALLPADTDINAFRFYGESSAANVATIALDNIRWYNSAVLPATHIVFNGVPATGAVNTNLTAFTAEAHSGSTTGPLANLFTDNITLSKATGPGNIAGTLAPAAVAGIANYADIQFDAAGTYTMDATAASPIVKATSGNVVISAGGSPNINVTGTLTPFNSVTGVPSAEQNYTVDGSNLTNNIVITPPTGFEISQTTAPFVPENPITLTETGGTVPVTTIYVRMNSTTLGANSGNITHVSAGSNNPNVAVSGNVIATEPTIQSAITFGVITNNTMVVNFSGGNGAKRILVARAGSAVDSDPVDGTTYTGNSVFGSGTQLGTGNYAVYAGTGNTVLVSNLAIGTTYHFAVYEYNDGNVAGAENYLVPGGVNNATTATYSVPYVWIGLDGDWQVPTNWAPTRLFPATNDSLLFTSAAVTETVTNVPAQTVGYIGVSLLTNTTLQAAAAGNVLTIGDLTGTDLFVEAGSSLNISGSNALIVNLVSGATASINDSMTFSAGAHRLTATTAGAISFNNGAVFTAGAGITGSVFGNTAPNANSVVFTSGSIYQHISGSNPFALGQPTSVVVFNTGSLFRLMANLIPSVSGRTYADFELNAPLLTPINASGSALLTMDNLTVTNGSISFGMTTGGFDLKGNIIVTSGDTLRFAPASAGTLTFNGTSAQSISNAGTLSFNNFQNVTINNATGVTLNSPITLAGVLTFTNGLINTTATNLLTMDATSSVTGASNVSYVRGPMKKIGNTPFVFPVGQTVGADGGFAQIGIGNIVGGLVTDEFVAEYRRGSARALGPITAVGLDHVSGCDYWTLDNPVGSPTVDITCYWSSNNTCNGAVYVTVLADLVIAHFNGTSWNAFGTVGTATGAPAAGTVVWTGVSTFSPFSLGSISFNNPLPITINYFNGAKQNGNHLLNWKVTCVSTPHATLELQRSTDGGSYATIYSIYATALRCQQPFDFTDNTPAKGTNYYRLKMTDADGKVTYSSIVHLINASKGMDILNIAPNPIVDGNFNLKISAAENVQMELVITDMQGRVLQTQKLGMMAGFNSIPVSLRNLAAGTYQLFGHTAEGRTRVLRFVIQ